MSIENEKLIEKLYNDDLSVEDMSIIAQKLKYFDAQESFNASNSEIQKVEIENENEKLKSENEKLKSECETIKDWYRWHKISDGDCPPYGIDIIVDVNHSVFDTKEKPYMPIAVRKPDPIEPLSYYEMWFPIDPYKKTLRKAIAIDFDGTLCENKYPEIGNPRSDVIQRAVTQQKYGAGLILWTCREGKLLDDAIKWCDQVGIHFDAVNESLPEWIEAFGGACRKVGATEYWDDRAVKV